MSRSIVFRTIKKVGDQIDTGPQSRAVVVRVLRSGGVVIGIAYPGETNAQVVAAYRVKDSRRKRVDSRRLTESGDMLNNEPDK